MSNELVRYDAMCRAIAEAHAVDEVKDIRDKARAIEMYARQAQNTEAEQQAREIRLRAERKCGQMLAGEVERAPAHRPEKASSDMTLSDLGITRNQSSQWQQLAAIPADAFEADLADPMWRPTTTGLLERQEARVRGPLAPLAVDDDALWLWGKLDEIERRGLLGRDPDELWITMLPHMRETTLRLAPLVADWLRRMA
jgi:hypothetical protein